MLMLDSDVDMESRTSPARQARRLSIRYRLLKAMVRSSPSCRMGISSYELPSPETADTLSIPPTISSRTLERTAPGTRSSVISAARSSALSSTSRSTVTRMR